MATVNNGAGGGRAAAAAVALFACAVLGMMASGVVGDCSALLPPLEPCLNFVTNQQNSPPPDCCSGLATVVKSNASCLCLVIGTPSIPNLNVTRAEELPALCNVSVPPLNQLCPGTVVPPQTAPIPSSEGTKTNAMPPNMYMGPMADQKSFAFPLAPSTLLPMALISALATTFTLQLQF